MPIALSSWVTCGTRYISMNSMTRGHDHQHESRVHEQALGLRREFVLPFERVAEALKYLGQPARPARRRAPGSRIRCRTRIGAATSPATARGRLPCLRCRVARISRKRGFSIESRRSRMPSSNGMPERVICSMSKQNVIRSRRVMLPPLPNLPPLFSISRNVMRSRPMRRSRSSRSTSLTASSPPRAGRPVLSTALY